MIHATFESFKTQTHEATKPIANTGKSGSFGCVQFSYGETRLSSHNPSGYPGNL